MKRIIKTYSLFVIYAKLKRAATPAQPESVRFLYIFFFIHFIRAFVYCEIFNDWREKSSNIPNKIGALRTSAVEPKWKEIHIIFRFTDECDSELAALYHTHTQTHTEFQQILWNKNGHIFAWKYIFILRNKKKEMWAKIIKNEYIHKCVSVCVAA